MRERLDTDELVALIRGVFRPRPEERTLALLVDLPDANLPDHPSWETRRAMVAEWHGMLSGARDRAGLERVSLVLYPNARRNNADLPPRAWIHAGGPIPSRAEDLKGPGVEFPAIFDAHRILVAATELSATAPLKLAAPKHRFRAATMPGFTEAMIPALRLDFEEVHRRCVALKERLDRASAARLVFEAAGSRHELHVDLRHRKATASGGLIREPGTAGNVPSGETYVVPYEGERPGDASRTVGTLPLELDGELFTYRIEENRVRDVMGGGPRAAAERREVEAEPAYANVAELGFGILADYGIKPIGELLLDEKLGLHIAFGRSDHFGGSVGAKDFRSPERVVHIDRVYLPEVQPSVRVVSVDLEEEEGTSAPLMRDGNYLAGSP